MKWSEAHPRNFLNASDIPVTGLAGRIISIGIEDVAGDGKPGSQKPVIHLDSLEKGIVVNKTNGTILAECFGEQMEACIGEYVKIMQGRVMFQGRIVPSVMLIPADGPPAT